ncbi:hypothetical protein DY000_02058591 [Brassica cretica]|uniref:Uncharacterized protein n=1 Tax=Brassica cretica TaxID=69181 RepID=A0ABQ7AZ63_BRACR|nr:hypothetical protein DY000_02058591 [Brassica cretica]
MSSSHGDKRSSDVEMGETTSPAPIPTSPVEAPACVADYLSFREKLIRRQAEKKKGRAADSMPPPPARKEIVLALHAPSIVPVTQPKGRKRKFTKGGDGNLSSKEARA